MRTDITGLRFGRLIAAQRASNASNGEHRWLCHCDCGQTKTVRAYNLETGRTRSCGCFNLQRVRDTQTSHGHTINGVSSKTYASWEAMKRRCYNPHWWKYSDYGGRGIIVCDRWRNSFTTFLADMGERPDGKTLDRIDPDGNYEPGNCRWATTQQQARNKRAA